MKSWWMRVAMASGLMLLAACGSTVNQDGSGGSGGTGGGTGGSGGEGGVIPPECAVEASESGPYAVTFQFENGGASPAFLREDCFLQYTIESCEDGYSSPVAIHASCSQPCSSSTQDCLVCGACLMASVPVDIGAQATDAWSGTRYTFGTTAAGCSCHEPHVARAGRYRIRVPVYASDMDAQAGSNPSYEVTINFELPAPNGVVVVPIGQSP